MVNFGEKDCLNLPNRWMNRVSSIFTKKCIILYTEADCKSDKLKAALIKDKVYFDVLLKSTTNIPSYNLNGSK